MKQLNQIQAVAGPKTGAPKTGAPSTGAPSTGAPSTGDDPCDICGPYKDRYLTIPNVICIARIIGSLSLIWLAIAQHAVGFLVAFFLLHLSDWIDGKLARWLNQRSDFGARLDSVSDAILYACLITGCFILKWGVLQDRLIWIAMPVISYAATSIYGFMKYDKVPSYHTYAAKLSNWLVLAAVVVLLLDLPLWPFYMASIGSTLTNLEAIAITYLLPKWQADVLTVLHIIPQKSRQPEQAD